MNIIFSIFQPVTMNRENLPVADQHADDPPVSTSYENLLEALEVNDGEQVNPPPSPTGHEALIQPLGSSSEDELLEAVERAERCIREPLRPLTPRGRGRGRLNLPRVDELRRTPGADRTPAASSDDFSYRLWNPRPPSPTPFTILNREQREGIPTTFMFHNGIILQLDDVSIGQGVFYFQLAFFSEKKPN
jgi:hypothetical protein